MRPEKQQRWLDTHAHISVLDKQGADRLGLLGDILTVLDNCDAALQLAVSHDPIVNDSLFHDAGILYLANEKLGEFIKGAPGRLFGGCMVNPHFLDASFRTMEAAFEKWGFTFLGEMLQYMMKYEMKSNPAVRIVRRAVDYDVPVQIHISTSNWRNNYTNTNGEDQLRDFFELYQQVPEAKYILAHFVGASADNPPIADIYLDLIEKEFKAWPDNCWIEIRDFSSPGVASALRRVPVNRLLAGTDWVARDNAPFPPYGSLFDSATPYPPAVSSLVRLLKSAGATTEMIEAIAYKNAELLLFHK